MSADNFYVVKAHPLGGYTYVQGFASDPDDTPLPATEAHPQYPTVRAAYLAACGEPICEYGVSVDPSVSWPQDDAENLMLRMAEAGRDFVASFEAFNLTLRETSNKLLRLLEEVEKRRDEDGPVIDNPEAAS